MLVVIRNKLSSVSIFGEFSIFKNHKPKVRIELGLEWKHYKCGNQLCFWKNALSLQSHVSNVIRIFPKIKIKIVYVFLT